MSKILPGPVNGSGSAAPVAGRKSPGGSSNPQFQPYSLLRAIWKQKIPALGIWALVSVLTVLFVMRLPRTYQAEAVVMIGGTSLSKDMVPSTVTTEMQDRMEQIRQRVLSRDSLIKLMETFHLHEGDRKSMPTERVLEYMKDEIDMKLDRGWGPLQPNTFRVSVQAKDAESAAKVANYLATFFVEENRSQRETQADSASDFFDQRMMDAKKQVEQSEARLNDFKTTFAGELPQQQDALLASLGQTRTQLQGVQDALSRAAQARLLLNTSLESAKNAEIETRRLVEQAAAARRRAPAAVMTSNGVVVSKGLTEVQRLEEEIAALRQRYGERHPDIRRARARLEEAKAREQAEMAAAGPASSAETGSTANAAAALEAPIDGPEHLLRQTLTEQHDRVETLKAQIQIADQEDHKLSEERRLVIAEIANIEARIRKLPMREQEMASVMRDYEVGKSNYESMVDKKLAADLSRKLEEDKGAPAFQLLEPARTPAEPVKPKRSLLAMGGSVFGLLLGLVAAIALEMRKQVILGEWELPPGTPVLGRIVELPRRELPAIAGDGISRSRKRA